MRHRYLATLAGVTLAGAAQCAPQPLALGEASGFAVLGGSTVTSTGATAVSGSVGVAPGTAIVFPTATAANAQYGPGVSAAGAHADLETALTAAQALPGAIDLTGLDLGGMVLTPGVYMFSSSAQLTGTLTLDDGGDTTGAWVFQIGSTLTTASGSSIAWTRPALARDLFWAVGSSATLGTGSAFAGTILARASITLDTGASLLGGRLLADTGAVTLDSNAIALPAAAPSGAAPVPEPATWAMVAGGFAVLGSRMRRRRLIAFAPA